MASKGKSKLKKHNSKFGSKCIDMKRFAYDVIVRSALRFGIPENCISIWEGSENDYGCPEFCLVMSRLTLVFQIEHRYELHTIFNNRYASNKLESFKSVGVLLQDAIKELTRNFQNNIISEVVITLSIACELVLFLYSKNLNLYLKELAGYWFDCYFHVEKQKFDKLQGLEIMYNIGNEPKRELMDAFYDTFISVHCLPYEASVKDEHLEDLFIQSYYTYDKKITRRYSLKEVVDSPIVRYIKDRVSEFYAPPSTSELDKDSGSDLPVHTGLGIVPQEVLFRGDGASDADATLSQNLPGASPQKGAKHRQQRRPRGKSSLCSSVEQGLRQLRLDSSGTKLSSEKKPSVSVADDPISSQNLPSASRQETVKHSRLSSGQKKKQS
ncbi:hypothetical protein AVEN_59548-1 [Araneus ventricosus]|uniref:Uncharacterized protein n=1 Tax=Araneus ventricosus TaxID=182803 RepID=A0A4Y2CGK6_ARAVE|nr:hypothetical protein AVEN_59548-1 [Araneus ventricosus]